MQMESSLASIYQVLVWTKNFSSQKCHLFKEIVKRFGKYIYLLHDFLLIVCCPVYQRLAGSTPTRVDNEMSVHCSGEENYGIKQSLWTSAIAYLYIQQTHWHLEFGF